MKDDIKKLKKIKTIPAEYYAIIYQIHSLVFLACRNRNNFLAKWKL